MAPLVRLPAFLAVTLLVACKDEPRQTTPGQQEASASSGGTSIVAASSDGASASSKSAHAAALASAGSMLPPISSSQHDEAFYPKMFIDTPRVSGSRSPNAVWTTIMESEGQLIVDKRESDGLHACYSRAAAKDRKLAGNLVVSLTIDAKGSVASATNGGPDFPDQTVTECVLTRLKSISFPATTGTATVTLPIRFSRNF